MKKKKKWKKEETVAHGAFQNILQNNAYNSKKLKDGREEKPEQPNYDFNQRTNKIFDEMMEIRKDKQFFLYLYAKP